MCVGKKRSKKFDSIHACNHNHDDDDYDCMPVSFFLYISDKLYC